MGQKNCKSLIKKITIIDKKNASRRQKNCKPYAKEKIQVIGLKNASHEQNTTSLLLKKMEVINQKMHV